MGEPCSQGWGNPTAGSRPVHEQSAGARRAASATTLVRRCCSLLSRIRHCRSVLDNFRPSRARSSIARTLSRAELEEHLDRLARVRGARALNELREGARLIAPALDAEKQLAELEDLIGALLGTRKANLRTPAAKARQSVLTV